MHKLETYLVRPYQKSGPGATQLTPGSHSCRSASLLWASALVLRVQSSLTVLFLLVPVLLVPLPQLHLPCLLLEHLLFLEAISLILFDCSFPD